MAQVLSVARKNLADIYRPAGFVKVSTVAGLTGTAPAGFVASPVNNIDLTLPIRGFRMIITGRVNVATADYTSVTPESLLNLVSNILITGTNSRQGGNVTLLNMDLATLFGLGMLTGNRFNYIEVTTASGVQTLHARPTMPYGNVFPGTHLGGDGAGNFDFRIGVDVPFAPFASDGHIQSGFVVRKDEWGNSLNVTFTFPTITDNAANPLGTSAATTVTKITAYGSTSGAMSVALFSLPVKLGNARTRVVPGVMSRATQPISTILQTTASAAKLVKLSPQSTPRVYLKIGVGTASPVFTSLNDAIVTALGIQKGDNSNIKNVLDSYATKIEVANEYRCDAIQGFYALDFIQSGNPDSAYQGQDPSVLGDGSDWYVVGDVTGTANGQGFIVQEQILQLPG